MANTMQRCEGGIDDASTGSPSSISDETDPAGVVLESRVVQARVTQVSYSRYRQALLRATDDYTKRVASASTFHTSRPAGRALRDPPVTPGGAALQTTVCASSHTAAPFAAMARGMPVRPLVTRILAVVISPVKRLQVLLSRRGCRC